jgi:hypothetical protein
LLYFSSLPKLVIVETKAIFTKQMRSPTMRATFVIVLLSVIGRLALAQQDAEDVKHRVLPYSYGAYGGYGGYKGYYASGSGKGVDSEMSKGK